MTFLSTIQITFQDKRNIFNLGILVVEFFGLMYVESSYRHNIIHCTSSIEFKITKAYHFSKFISHPNNKVICLQIYSQSTDNPLFLTVGTMRVKDFRKNTTEVNTYQL